MAKGRGAKQHAKKTATEKVPDYACKPCRQLATKGALAGAVMRGKAALKANHRQLVVPDVDCSANIEAAWKRHQQAGERIFDYLIVRKEKCRSALVEVHPGSSTRNVTEVIEKKKGTLAIAARQGTKLDGAQWYWLATGTVKFKANDKYGKALTKHRIKQPRRKLTD